MSRIEPLLLQVGDEKVLGEWTRASSISAGLAQRARILLLAAAGHSNTEIGRLVFEPGWRWAESTCELVAIAVVDVSPDKA